MQIPIHHFGTIYNYIDIILQEAVELRYRVLFMTSGGASTSSEVSLSYTAELERLGGCLKPPR
jgi:hypothetical protein